MSIFGSTPPDESPSMHSSFARSRASLFDDESASVTQSQEQAQSTSNSLFQDDGSHWDMPTPRKQHSRADLLRTLLPAADVPESYIQTFDAVVRDHGAGGRVSSGGVTRVLASAKLDADAQAKITSIVAPGAGEIALGRNEFNVLLGLVGLAQEGETVSLDGIDERRRSELPFLFTDPCQAPALYCIVLCICNRMSRKASRPLYLLSVTATGILWMRPLGYQRCVGNWPSPSFHPRGGPKALVGRMTGRCRVSCFTLLLTRLDAQE